MDVSAPSLMDAGSARSVSSPIVQQRLSSLNGHEGGRPSIFTLNFFYSGSKNRLPKPQPLHTMAAIFIKCPRPLMAFTSLHTAIMAVVQLSTASKRSPKGFKTVSNNSWFIHKPSQRHHSPNTSVTDFTQSQITLIVQTWLPNPSRIFI
eukprot:Gb_02111 [translate_table: standard]